MSSDRYEPNINGREYCLHSGCEQCEDRTEPENARSFTLHTDQVAIALPDVLALVRIMEQENSGSGREQNLLRP